MKAERRGFLILSGLALLGAVQPAAQSRSKSRSRGKSEASPPLPEGVAARLDIANSAGGSVPGGATVVSGKWSVDAGAKKLKVAPEPLLDAWLEFGPEIRERGATLVAVGRAPGGGRLQSRFGVGLYGRNGFQLRLVAARQEVELVRRGAVLLRKPFAIDPEELCHLELSVRGERGHWIVSGRVWTKEGQRPEAPLFEYKIFGVELQFPLAGRSVLVATPFSGEPVAYAEATVYHGTRQADGGVKADAAP